VFIPVLKTFGTVNGLWQFTILKKKRFGTFQGKNISGHETLAQLIFSWQE